MHRPPQDSDGREVFPSEFFTIPEMSPTQDISDLFFQPQNEEVSNVQDEQEEDAGNQEQSEVEQIDETVGREASDEYQFTDQMPEQVEWEAVRSGSSEPEQQGQEPEQQDQVPQQEHGTAKYFFEHFTRIYPFEDNEIIFCVKIEPKDIGMLPKETWSLSNNSFLMHGFYCYHHLIFAKRKDRHGSQYIIGIPGIYHNRERFMAKMFGFENFKSIRRRELQQGDFGYWYLPVDLNSPMD